jgi:hypothetical protein
MPVGESDVLKIVVLAAGPYALLRGRCPRVVALPEPKEYILELVHPRICKQQRGIVLRHERRRVHLAVPFFDEKVQKLAANLRAG